MEGNEDIRIGYQDVAALAQYYDVSTDYLFGVTDNRQHRHIAVDKLKLSDGAIEVLQGGEINNRLVSELIAHPDFPKFSRAMEIYIDRKVLPQMQTANAMFKLAETTSRESFDVADNDEYMTILQEAVVDEDEYLRYRISERFNILLKNLFDAHKKDALPDEQVSVLQDMRESIETYQAQKSQEDKARVKMHLLAKQLNLNLSGLTREETEVFMKVVQQSGKYKSAASSGGKRKR